MADILLPLSKVEAENLMRLILEHEGLCGHLLYRIEKVLSEYEEVYEYPDLGYSEIHQGLDPKWAEKQLEKLNHLKSHGVTLTKEILDESAEGIRRGPHEWDRECLHCMGPWQRHLELRKKTCFPQPCTDNCRHNGGHYNV